MPGPEPMKPDRLSSSPPRAEDRLALHRAGEQFEALLIEQMLKTARPDNAGVGNEWRAIAERHMAEALGKASPFGIATLLGGHE